MERRLVLAAVAVLAALALAGCADAAGSIRMEPVNDTALAERASEETTGGGFYPAIDRQRTARQVITNGSATVVDHRPPLASSLPYEYRGEYYNLSHEVVDSQPGVQTMVRVDYNATDPNGTRLAFGDLSPADRAKLRPMFENPPEFRREGPEGELTFDYVESAAGSSTLLERETEQVVVTYEGRQYAVEVAETREVTLDTYRYEATRVADSPEAYADALTRRYAFTLSDLDENETRVVESALDDGYYADSTDDAGFDALVDRFLAHPAVERDDHSGHWIVRYEGQRYWVELRFGAFVENEEGTITSPDVTPT